MGKNNAAIFYKLQIIGSDRTVYIAMLRIMLVAAVGFIYSYGIPDCKAGCPPVLNLQEDSCRSQKDVQVPVLCYHQVRDWKATDSKSSRTYIVPVAAFRQQIEELYNAGFHTITPDQLTDHLTYGSPLPAKPVLITFDDGTISQITNALPVLVQWRFGAVFFIMTVTLGRPGYMSSEDVSALAGKGFIIGCHTWDHHNVTGYRNEDWETQLVKPTLLLRKITGKEIRYFAYPFGAWNKTAIHWLKAQHYQAAFQLAGKADACNPAFTIRRIIVDGHWNGRQLLKAIDNSFR